MAPLVQAVEREGTARLSSYLGHHVAFPSFWPRFAVFIQVGITKVQLVFMFVFSIVLTFFRIDTRYKVCTTVFGLFTEQKSQLPSGRHGYCGRDSHTLGSVGGFGWRYLTFRAFYGITYYTHPVHCRSLHLFLERFIYCFIF